MKLSVIVPAYNAEKTIVKCLESIIEQDYDDFEIIVINDGSTDRTEDVVNGIINKYPERKIRIIYKDNAGLPQARKTGVENAYGEYIGFVDADDWIEKEMYSRMINEAEEKKADIVSCDLVKDFPNKEEEFCQKYIGEVINGKEAFINLNNRISVFQYCWNKIYKKSILERVNYPKVNIIGEDYNIVSQALLMADRVVPVGYIGCHYIQNMNSMSHKMYSKLQKDSFLYYRKVLNDLYKIGDKKVIKSSENYVANELIWIIISMRNGNYDKKVAEWIVRFIRKRIFRILANKYNSILFKGSAMVTCISYKLICKVFNVVYKSI